MKKRVDISFKKYYIIHIRNEKGTYIMTKFNKDDFTWDGMYLMYRGRHTGSRNMEEVHPDCHPSWIGQPKPEFIARFKYGSKPWKSWVKCLCENYTVESYIAECKATNPLAAVQKVGYSGKGRY